MTGMNEEKAREIVNNLSIDEGNVSCCCEDHEEYYEARAFLAGVEAERKRSEGLVKAFEKMRQALVPFEKEIETWRPHIKDSHRPKNCDDPSCVNSEEMYFTVGDMRKAKEALALANEASREKGDR